jgi:hypothetical protein
MLHRNEVTVIEIEFPPANEPRQRIEALAIPAAESREILAPANWEAV